MNTQPPAEKQLDPLETALSASKPIPATPAEERESLAVELLVQPHHRRISVDDHHRWQTTGRPPHLDDADLDLSLCDAERHLNKRGKRDACRVLSILDELERGGR